MSDSDRATQVHRIYIRATPEQVWEAITSREWTGRYGYRSPAEYELKPGGSYRAVSTEEMIAQGAPPLMCDGEVLEVDAPRRLAQTWRALFGPETIAEGFHNLTWDIERHDNTGATILTITHELEGAPITASIVSGQELRAGGGWDYVLGDLKSLLETGSGLTG